MNDSEQRSGLHCSICGKTAEIYQAVSSAEDIVFCPRCWNRYVVKMAKEVAKTAEQRRRQARKKRAVVTT
ncbi:MAG: hypothetical protein ACTSYX_04950 [Candidatus Thorarchaeota archaeon]